MSALRCTQKLRSAMGIKPSSDPPGAPEMEAPPASGALLGDWTLNLLHLRPVKLVLAVSEHERLGFLLAAAPFDTLAERFSAALFAHLCTLKIPPAIARRECDAMQPLTISATTRHENRRSIQRSMSELTEIVQATLYEAPMPIASLNAYLARQISAVTAPHTPAQLVHQRLCGEQ
jgi:hypothetical protein